jgi:hypothetical protein
MAAAVLCMKTKEKKRRNLGKRRLERQKTLWS